MPLCKIAVGAFVLTLAFAGQASAHAHLVSEIPAARSMAMPPPTELRLKFSEGLESKLTRVKLVGPDRKAVQTGEPRLDAADNSLLILPIAAPLADGHYTVEWKAVSTDGHKTSGTYSFEAMQ